MEIPVSDRRTQTWTPESAQEHYRVDAWGNGYFFVNDEGHVAAQPTPEEDAAIDIHSLVEHLREQDITFPVLIRFQDLLRRRVQELNHAFQAAVAESGYENRYRGVYPIKVNQLYEVVDEVLDAGKPFDFGLECGSKPELIATLPFLEDDDTLLICNGYKDAVMVRMILTAQQLGKNVIPVVEKYDEFERIMRYADEIGVRPRFGVRLQLPTRGSGKWAASSGDGSKFGITLTELLRMIDHLDGAELIDSLVLLHFHLGSQISDIQTLKVAVRQVTRVYTQLRARGMPIEYIDVGGGLGVNYVSGLGMGEDAINYSLQEYANGIVHAVKEVCDAAGVRHPTLVSESGRALTAHHSVLIVETVGAYRKERIEEGWTPPEDAHEIVRGLYDTYRFACDTAAIPLADRPRTLLEAYHDAVEQREQAHSLFRLGYFQIDDAGTSEKLYWSTMRVILAQLGELGDHAPPELSHIDEELIEQYLCSFSVFQSILDHWAIGQRFPVLPIHRLDEEPTVRGVLVDLTCDSDGKVSRYVALDDDRPYLDVHPLREGEPYYLGFFLMGAYQDIMGDMHNLFGRVSEVHVYADDDEPEGYYIEKTIPGASIEEMLAQVQYFPNDLHRRMRKIIRAKIADGTLRPKQGMQILDQYDATFRQHTYYDTTAD